MTVLRLGQYIRSAIPSLATAGLLVHTTCMCEEKPKDWDRYVNALLWALFHLSFCMGGAWRDYSKSYDSYGQKNRLTQKPVQSEKSVARHMGSGTWCTTKSQVCQKRQFHYRAKERTYKQGDMVFMLLHTSDNKLLMQWKGPFEVVEHNNGCE